MGLKEKIKALPNSPGVYLMKDAGGALLYVGKADNLKKRVSSYFHPHRKHPERIELMVSKVADIDYIPTATSAEALIYENSLIKQLSPRYNVALRDDKSYPMLKLTVNETFPRLFITRQKKKDGALYYGPYASAKLLKQAVFILQQLFPLRKCNVMPKRVCLNYHIRQCFGPCEGKIGKGAYDEMISQIKLFLDGRQTELVRRLAAKMKEASNSEDFEEALRLRDRIEALTSVRKGKVLYNPADEFDELKNLLGLKGQLSTIEAFDVSNIMGEDAVGSMVYFYKGKPKKAQYRKFRIRTVAGIDDYSMMREIIRRRYARAIEEERPLPDLIVIDGGKGHLGVALDELRKLGLSGIQVIGIAKPARLHEKPFRAGGEFEHVYKADSPKPVVLPRDSKALHLLERIRDEAHRFAISYHKSLQSKKVGASVLDGIPGIGEKRKKALMNHFGSVDKIRDASVEDVMKVKGFNERSSRAVIEYLKGSQA
ncbi:MAG: excinuclease ABC subunit C [Candidatus Omnitrophica bacterium]|nr:excinuclease ABC subunit C [Candidatus Omnitrophota bacterium]